MLRKRINVLTENELQILQLLWTENRPLSRPEILERYPLPESNKQTIHRYLNSMIEKGVLIIDGSVVCGKRPGRLYSPTITREEYVISQLDKLLPDTSPQHRLLSVMSAWIDEKYVDDNLLLELEELLQSKRKEFDKE